MCATIAEIIGNFATVGFMDSTNIHVQTYGEIHEINRKWEILLQVKIVPGIQKFFQRSSRLLLHGELGGHDGGVRGIKQISSDGRNKK